ncbi:MAG: hypothetical protein EHM18_19135 [Acidobacteria bacterium]|nr:MAG: hypothetical protein EHM18_19135 [Acidobacteriota bacterium]
MNIGETMQARAPINSEVDARPLWSFCILPALTMSLGWGLRGSIGGGPLGAMIPGAMIGLVLCILLGRSSDAGRGWKVINDPKLVYFSNPIDRPREELWAGLWLGGLLLTAWLRSRVPSLFALCGAIGGGIGFAVGAALQPLGRDVWAWMPLGWWKGMELTFGALLGVSYGLCAWRLRKDLRMAGPPPSPVRPAYVGIACASLAVVLAIVADEILPIRFSYTVGAAALASLVWFSSPLAWQTAVTATYAAFSWDLADNLALLPAWMSWTWVVVTTVTVAILVARYPRPRATVLLLTWTAVGTAFRYLLPPSRISSEAVTMLIVFVLFAVAATWLVAGMGERGTSAVDPKPES